MHFLKLFVRQEYDEFFAKQTSKHLSDFSYRLSPARTVKGIWKLLFILYRAETISKFISLPSWIWYNKVFDKEARRILKKKDACIVVSSFRDLCFLLPCIELAKKRNKGIKAICIFEDTIKYYQGGQKFSLEYVKRIFDIVYSYNETDIKCYNFKKIQVCVREFDVIETTGVPESDLFFVGQNKDRLKVLLDIFVLCNNYGLKCDFHINGVPTLEQKFSDQIIYNKSMSYYEVIRHCQKTKCIVNIIQDGAEGITLRDVEAIGMNKLLLTNSTAIFGSEMYTPSKVIPLSQLADNLGLIKEGTDNTSWNNTEKYSDVMFYKTIENDLNSL